MDSVKHFMATKKTTNKKPVAKKPSAKQTKQPKKPRVGKANTTPKKSANAKNLRLPQRNP
jgi:hypothetical protein